MRFGAGVRKLKAMIDNGSAGKPTLLAGRYWCNMLGGAWWRDKSKSNGQVYEQVIHIYDLALHLFGEPTSISGLMDNLYHGSIADYTIEDTSLGTVRFKSGALASVTGSNCALPEHFVGDWRVVCEKAMLDYRTTGQAWVKPDESTLCVHGSGGLKREEFTESGDGYLAETQDFVAAIRGSGATLSPAREGLRAVKLVTKVIESAAKSGSPVAW
jgi:predicted dehydrogenase